MSRMSWVLVMIFAVLISGWAATNAKKVDTVKLRTAKAGEVNKSVKCVIDGMSVTLAKDSPVADYQGKSYYFCAGSEPALFQANPGKYLPVSSINGSSSNTNCIVGSNNSEGMKHGGCCN